MNSYIKSVIFAVVFAFIAWDITLGFAPQGSTTIHKTGSSASFIQQESNQNVPIPSSNPKTPISVSITHTNTQNTQNNNRGGTRDYVNPNIQTQNKPANPQNNGGSNLNPTSSQPQNTQNRGSVRDYVNPNLGPQQTPIRASNQPQQSSTTPKPSSPQNRGNVRDYVNPNHQSGKPSQQQPSNTQNTNTRDYVAPRPARPEFPGLPPKNPTPIAGFPPLPVKPQSNPSGTTPISYANKVAGGVTTKAPLSSGPTTPSPSGSTTEKPDDGPSDTELREFSEALLRRDINNAGKFVTVNLQGKTTSQSKNDEAPERLLEVKPEAFQIPTISKLKLLHNNYILNTNENEHYTAQEKAEENDLLEAMISTPIMQYTKNFLIAKGKLAKDPKAFKDLLKVLWFNMYSRGGGRIGSSGFEHIFLAELKRNEVSGLHNWVYFDQAEINKVVDYLGYMKKIDLGEKGSILKFHFKLNGVDKPVDSMFIGTSPELEVALYTTCYLFRVDKICPLKLNGNNFIVRTYNFRYRGKNMIGSAFPEI